jgi:hypothetical protein
MGYGWVGSVRFESSWFGSWWDACERWSVLATGVTPVSLWPLIIVSNLSVWSCIDIVLVYVLSLLINHVVKPFLL